MVGDWSSQIIQTNKILQRQEMTQYDAIIYFSYFLVDTTPPTVTYCPFNIDSVGGRHVVWNEPNAYDISENVTVIKSHLPGVFITEQTNVIYTFMDSFGNAAYCRFTIDIVCEYQVP